MTRIAFLGARGMLGRDAAPLFEGAGHDVARGDLPEVDITSASSLAAFLDAHPSDIVLNAAAYTDVDGAESHGEEALRINGEGARTVAEACRERGAFLVQISTDYVFPGKKPEGYLPGDPTGPAINSYGKSKLAGEEAVRAVLPPDRVLICRTQWLYGRHGKNFVDTIRSLAASLPSLRVVDDQWGVPTHTHELARQILWCIKTGRSGAVHAVGGGGPVTWFRFAKEIAAIAGLACTVSPCTSADFPRPAPRPAHAWLKTVGAPPALPWKESLRDYLRGVCP